ncbi:hypothetical protein OTERR_13920 [Oryzomicrobium terrae]|uniref:Lipoprotein n=1 Tax=Oryzomicrobium terrae TaxID=1735038 RepID=A0A5C1E9D0_9RHOO|nr:hypothetical protein [Oryzomicrobium terrae]QEL64868.1 hypothetical protein OTERR_13920 [Oryzomicrobium terrae]
MTFAFYFFPSRRWLRRLALAAWLPLAACQSLPPAASLTTIPGSDGARVLDALALGQRMSNAGGDEQKRELSHAQQAYNREKSLENRLNLATLLALPTPLLGDETRAIALLEPVAAGSPGPARDYAGYLLAHLRDRVREGKSARQLKEQLDALKSLERQLIERGGR